jgi:hypothetical protein
VPCFGVVKARPACLCGPAPNPKGEGFREQSDTHPAPDPERSVPKVRFFGSRPANKLTVRHGCRLASRFALKAWGGNWLPCALFRVLRTLAYSDDGDDRAHGSGISARQMPVSEKRSSSGNSWMSQHIFFVDADARLIAAVGESLRGQGCRSAGQAKGESFRERSMRSIGAPLSAHHAGFAISRMSATGVWPNASLNA